VSRCVKIVMEYEDCDGNPRWVETWGRENADEMRKILEASDYYIEPDERTDRKKEETT
jgi:hypothetical protein